jgi:hypothetical protein
MGVASLEDLDMAAPMLLYSLSTSSTRNYNRKRKQRELQQEQEQHTAAEDELLFSPAAELPEESESSASVSAEKTLVPSPPKKKFKSSPDKKKSVSSPDKKKSGSPEKIKRTRVISRKKQESMSSLDTTTTKGSTSKGSTKKASSTKAGTNKASTTKTTKKKAKAGQSAKKVAPGKQVRRTTYTKKSSGVPGDPTAFNSKGTVANLPTINPGIKLPWPMKGETFPSLHPNDVLSGRGNGVAIYPGNRQFREFIRLFKDRYVRAYRNEKGTVASDVIKTVLSLNPPGRFVEKANKTGTEFQLVDYSRALEKTSQALREGSAALRVMVFKDMDRADKAKAQELQNRKNAMAGGLPILEAEKARARAMEKARAMAKVKVEEKGQGQG